ncbi:hypothetical protein LINPERPRIM_LOCUS30203, partial [Linum perenne]
RHYLLPLFSQFSILSSILLFFILFYSNNKIEQKKTLAKTQIHSPYPLKPPPSICRQVLRFLHRRSEPLPHAPPPSVKRSAAAIEIVAVETTIADRLWSHQPPLHHRKVAAATPSHGRLSISSPPSIRLRCGAELPLSPPSSRLVRTIKNGPPP